ncbi:MAG TPA: hypothetical protein VGO91_14675 [Pyrinomonadaceae bacterium]|jgi:hypothetical protein|nr:hypothetical protein [Pyrinomonadaceae bacterium]
MRETGNFIGGRWTAKVELLPGEFEVFNRRARHKGRLGQLIFTNQRFIWRPSFRRRADQTEVLLIPHERVNACDITRPWQQLFLQRALRLRLHDGETITLNLRDADTILPVIRDYMSRERYRPGELFK